MENGRQHLRKHCDGLPTRDIAYYNCCPHLCRYCYANYDEATVRKNYALHDVNSSFLIGGAKSTDVINVAAQKSWEDKQLLLF